MTTHRVVSHEEWIEARRHHLAREKELTRLRDQLRQERRELPWEKVDKHYVFDGANGKGVPHRPLRGPEPARRLPLHVRSELGGGLQELLVLDRQPRRHQSCTSPTAT